ncbi:MAG: DUF4214 domain-containing protein, partial [Ruthenibacterium sp.]
TCHVTILPSEDPNFGSKPNLIRIANIDSSGFDASVGQSGFIRAATYPTMAPAEPITWTQTNPAILDFEAVENGKVKYTVTGVGTTIITAHCGELSASVEARLQEGTPPTPPASDGVADFVERLYTKVLNRGSDAQGKANWINQLKTKANTGAEAARGFFMSKEFEARNVSNNDYLSILYHAFFNRDADQGGLTVWTNQLNSGTSREAILCGFANSAEFQTVCNSYGIERGTITAANPVAPSAQLNAFVSRLYEKLLDREYDAKGFKSWTNAILKKQQTPQQVAHGFVFSPEFMNHKYTDEVFVEYM